MLDGLLGRGYSAKCKSLIKQTKSRIDVIRRKRSATLKFLKKDIADLLTNGLDINAYGRAEGLVTEIILSSCYDFVEKSCDIMSNHLSVMQKVRECPEDCREAASCLMFAAARFSDLPELRELRQILQDRYGNALEYYVNQAFVENLTSKPSSLEKKVQLMKDIAIEFSIVWDYKAFEQRISNPPVFLKDCKTVALPAKRHDCLHKNGHGLESCSEAFVSKRDDEDFVHGPGVPRNGCKPLNGSDETVPKRINNGYSFQGRQKYATKTENGDMKAVGLSGSSNVKREQNPEGDFKMHDNGRENTYPQNERKNALSKNSYVVSSHDEIGVKFDASKPSTVTNHADRHDGKVMGKVHQDRTPRSNPLHHDGQHDADKLIAKVHEYRTPMLNPFHNVAVPPPYVKPSSKSKDSVSGANVISSHVNLNIGSESVPKSPSTHSRDAASTQSEDTGVDHSNKEKQGNGHVRRSRHKHEKDFCDPVDATGFPLPKPRSMRRRHSRSRSGHHVVDSVEESEIVTRRSASRRYDSRRGLQILFDDEHHKDGEEERIIDKLLIHYSKKPSSGDSVKEKGKAKSRGARHVDICTGEPTGGGRRDRQDEKSEIVSPPARSISLPREQSGTSEVTKVYTRAVSLQADRSTEARHVHPKLPDYDNLAAQFAALRGR